MSVLRSPVATPETGVYPFNGIITVPINPRDPTSDWEKVQNCLKQEFGSPLTTWGIDMLRSGLDRDLRCVVIEPRYVCKDHSNLHNHYYSKKFPSRSVHASRLHFFRCRQVNVTKLALYPEEYQEDYIGFSVIRPVAERCLGRTIIDPFKIERGRKDGFYVLTTRFAVRIFGLDLFVSGFPYLAQDGDAILCGQAALWNICRYFSERYPLYREVRPHDLLALTRKDRGRTIPSAGMDDEDYAAILHELGAHPVVIKTKQNLDDPGLISEKFDAVCAYLESGVPILASFNGHAATLIGHTLDLNRPLPDPLPAGLINHTFFFGNLSLMTITCFPTNG